MKKMILASIMTILSANIALASSDCPDLELITKVIAQVNNYNPTWSMGDISNSADIKIKLDDTLSYSCKRTNGDITVSSKKNGQDLPIGTLTMYASLVGKFPIDTITIDTVAGVVKLNLENPNTPFVGISLRNNALILRDGRQIAP